MSDLGAGIQRLDGWHCNEAEALIEVLIGGTALQKSKRNEVQFSLQNEYQLAVAANRPTGMHQTLKRKVRELVWPFYSISAPAHTSQASGSGLTPRQVWKYAHQNYAPCEHRCDVNTHCHWTDLYSRAVVHLCTSNVIRMNEPQAH